MRESGGNDRNGKTGPIPFQGTAGAHRIAEKLLAEPAHCLDEPFSSLDHMRDQIIDLGWSVERLNCSVLMVSHDPRDHSRHHPLSLKTD